MRALGLQKLWLVGLLLGCGAAEGAPAPGPTQSVGGLRPRGPLERFCMEAIQACDTVAKDECMQIVREANKVVNEADIPCAAEAGSCDETGLCLDGLQDLPPPVVADASDQGQPTSMPASP